MTYPSQPQRQPSVGNVSPPSMRILFLDDDPLRAEIFLDKNPQAVWVETVPDCIARLEEPWDEVHLDHDLGGEQYVTQDREDCGMEVVRWLSLSFRPHLKKTRFVVHSHNPNGATMMGMQLMVNGYNVEVRPFGESPVETSTPSRVAPPPQQRSTPSEPFMPPRQEGFGQPPGASKKRSFLETLRYHLLSMLRPKTPVLDPAVMEHIRSTAERRAKEAMERASTEKTDIPSPSED